MRKHRPRRLRFSHNPKLLFQPPAAVALNPRHDLHLKPSRAQSDAHRSALMSAHYAVTAGGSDRRDTDKGREALIAAQAERTRLQQVEETRKAQELKHMFRPGRGPRLGDVRNIILDYKSFSALALFSVLSTLCPLSAAGACRLQIGCHHDDQLVFDCGDLITGKHGLQARIEPAPINVSNATAPVIAGLLKQTS